MKDTDEVIKMYGDKKMYNDLIRVTKQYRKQDLEETLSLCGKVRGMSLGESSSQRAMAWLAGVTL